MDQIFRVCITYITMKVLLRYQCQKYTLFCTYIMDLWLELNYWLIKILLVCFIYLQPLPMTCGGYILVLPKIMLSGVGGGGEGACEYKTSTITHITEKQPPENFSLV